MWLYNDKLNAQRQKHNVHVCFLIITHYSPFDLWYTRILQRYLTSQIRLSDPNDLSRKETKSSCLYWKRVSAREKKNHKFFSHISTRKSNASIDIVHTSSNFNQCLQRTKPFVNRATNPHDLGWWTPAAQVQFWNRQLKMKKQKSDGIKAEYIISVDT